MYRALLYVFLISVTNADILTEEECLNYTVYPVQYNLKIIPYMFVDSSYYHCELIITVIANAPNVRVIELDAKDLKIQDDSIRVLDGDTDLVNGARPYEYNSVNGKLYIYLTEPLRIYNAKNPHYYNVEMKFFKSVDINSEGVFLVKYYDEADTRMKYLYTTRLSPDKAKYFFPCFDNPRFEAVYKFKVYIPPQHTDMQYTNTSLVIAQELRRETTKDNTVIIDYIPSPQVSLHQVGFHFSQFSSIQVTARNTNDTLVVWAPATELPHYKFFLDFGENILNLIHDYASINRPLLYGPINIVAVPANLNGYEIGSWNLLTNGANKIAYVEDLTSIKQIERMTFDLSQQLSRIWLGNPGEMERTQWKEEWLKEGVATYLAYYFLTQYNHGLQSTHRIPLGMYGLQMKHKAMSIDWHRSTPALETFNSSLAIEIPSRYKDLVTMKTGSLLWMVENWLDSEKFHRALVKYINTRRGKYVSLQDFTTTLDNNTVECLYQFFNGSTASRILKSWFHQPGYPVINVQVLRDRNPNAIQLKQRKFSFTHDNRQESDYLIPISYIIQNMQNCYNCHQPRFTIGKQAYTFGENLNNGWIILNRNAAGYYRVNYDEVTWKLIAKSLKEDMESIDELNRAQIANDILALHTAGDLTQDLTMEVLNYLDNETSPTVWESVIAGFEYLKIEGASCHMTKILYKEWENFMRMKISSAFEKLLKVVRKHHQTRLFRSNIIEFAAELGHEQCLQYLKHIYEEHTRGNQSLDPDSRLACYYMLVNEMNSNFGNNLNAIEREDKVIAEHRARDKLRFLIKLPAGQPRPMPIKMTEDPPLNDIKEKTESHGGCSSLVVSSLTFIGTFLVITLR